MLVGQIGCVRHRDSRVNGESNNPRELLLNGEGTSILWSVIFGDQGGVSRMRDQGFKSVTGLDLANEINSTLHQCVWKPAKTCTVIRPGCRAYPRGPWQRSVIGA